MLRFRVEFSSFDIEGEKGYHKNMAKRNGVETIEVPKRIVDFMVEACQKWEEFRDELEDFVFSTDLGFIRKMRKARKEDRAGKTRSLEELKSKL